MLKGFLLSEIKEDLTREQLNQLWKNRIMQLKNVEQNGEDAFIKIGLDLSMRDNT